MHISSNAASLALLSQTEFVLEELSLVVLLDLTRYGMDVLNIQSHIFFFSGCEGFDIFLFATFLQIEYEITLTSAPLSSFNLMYSLFDYSVLYSVSDCSVGSMDSTLTILKQIIISLARLLLTQVYAFAQTKHPGIMIPLFTLITLFTIR